MKRRLVVLCAVAVAAITAATVAAATATVPAASSLARLVRITSPVPRGELATLTARVAPRRLCSIAVTYKDGRESTAKGLYPKRPRNGRVSWTWKVGTRTTPGRWYIRVACGKRGLVPNLLRRQALSREAAQALRARRLPRCAHGRGGPGRRPD